MRDEDPFRVRRMREELRELIRQEAANKIQFTRITKSSDTGQQDSVHGHQIEGSGEVNYDYFVRRFQHYGFRSRPPAGTWAIKINAGRSANAVIIAEDSERYAPTGIADGDVVLFNRVTGVQLYLKAADGSVLITDKQGSQVKLDGTGTIDIVASTVNVGGTTSLQPAVLGNNLESRLAALEAAHNAHTHAVSGTCPNGGGALTSGAAAATTNTVTSPGQNVRSSKVNVAP
ncbi:MAG TPA: phage baseplate assembly protein [Casimicrobiaceae bacterium]|nr:phage baseplate assembly protein [Casimicrobiaceae bacterium]